MAPRTKYKVTDVFVPGGLPKHTYVPRTDRLLEDQIASTKDNLCKIATVTGATKSGKTVLVRTVLQRDNPIWIDGGSVTSMTDFLEMLADSLEVETGSSTVNQKGSSQELSGGLAGEGGIPLVAKAKGKVAAKMAESTSTQTTTAVTRSISRRITNRLRDTHTPLVIDDFHYIPRELQGHITRFLKPLVFDGVPVIYLAIPHRRFDAVKVEREMNARIQQVQVPPWEYRELAQIAQLGFPLINISPDLNTAS